MSQDDLRRIKAAFACMTDAELDAISGATYGLPQIARGLLAWLDSACVWQLRHRAGHNEDLQPLEARFRRKRTQSALRRRSRYL